jgi:NAD(P)-dependent dehydrogenase (short-subunit alcohol dehydrogenase family)
MYGGPPVLSNDSSVGKGETAGPRCHRITGKEDRIVPGGGNADAEKEGCLVGDDGKIAVVTGRNREIGYEICRQLARLGVNVILTARDGAKGRKAAEALQEDGLRVRFHPLDVDDPESIRRLREYVERGSGRLDILVNNAGINIDEGKTGENVDIGTVSKAVRTNACGPLLMCMAFLPLMRKVGYGRIVNVSSGLGSFTEMAGGYPAYRISKTALNAVMRVLAHELVGADIRVNSMCPGWVRTDMGGPEAERSVKEGADTAVWLATLPDGGPTGGFFRDWKPVPW